MPPDTVASLLLEGRRHLADCGTAALDARLLLQHVLRVDHAALIAGGRETVSAETAQAYRALLARRVFGEPVSRILGVRNFFGRDFVVSPEVLDPRADTETLVEAALPLLGQGRILDLGAGSGAIIVTLLAERPEASGVAVDLSPGALAITADNARRHGVASRLSLLEGSWFSPVEGCFDLIVSNPPYIPAGDIEGLDREVRDFDPHLALAGGTDGLDAYRVLAGGAARFLSPSGALLLEIGAGQAAAITGLFVGEGWQLAGQFRDLGGHVRVLKFTSA
jgi:release factor glutamine methyltransferase